MLIHVLRGGCRHRIYLFDTCPRLDACRNRRTIDERTFPFGCFLALTARHMTRMPTASIAGPLPVLRHILRAARSFSTPSIVALQPETAWHPQPWATISLQLVTSFTVTSPTYITIKVRKPRPHRYTNWIMMVCRTHTTMEHTVGDTARS